MLHQFGLQCKLSLVMVADHGVQEEAARLPAHQSMEHVQNSACRRSFWGGCCIRVDMSKVELVHPQVELDICQRLHLPALETMITEQLDPNHALQSLEAIQVHACSSLPV